MKGKFLFVILELLLILALVLAACGPAAAPEGDQPSLANAPEEPDAVQAAPEAGAYSITEPYRDYPDIDTLFSSYSTNEERLAACQIPEEILPNMTTEALVETIFLHPLRWTLYWNTNWTEGKVMLDWMESSFNAVPELYSRADGIAVLEGWTQEKEAQYEAEESYEQYIDLRIGQALLAVVELVVAQGGHVITHGPQGPELRGVGGVDGLEEGTHGEVTSVQDDRRPPLRLRRLALLF